MPRSEQKQKHGLGHTKTRGLLSRLKPSQNKSSASHPVHEAENPMSPPPLAAVHDSSLFPQPPPSAATHGASHGTRTGHGVHSPQHGTREQPQKTGRPGQTGPAQTAPTPMNRHVASKRNAGNPVSLPRPDVAPPASHEAVSAAPVASAANYPPSPASPSQDNPGSSRYVPGRGSPASRNQPGGSPVSGTHQSASNAYNETSPRAPGANAPGQVNSSLAAASPRNGTSYSAQPESPVSSPIAPSIPHGGQSNASDAIGQAQVSNAPAPTTSLEAVLAAARGGTRAAPNESQSPTARGSVPGVETQAGSPAKNRKMQGLLNKFEGIVEVVEEPKKDRVRSALDQPAPEVSGEAAVARASARGKLEATQKSVEPNVNEKRFENPAMKRRLPTMSPADSDKVRELKRGILAKEAEIQAMASKLTELGEKLDRLVQLFQAAESTSGVSAVGSDKHFVAPKFTADRNEGGLEAESPVSPSSVNAGSSLQDILAAARSPKGASQSGAPKSSYATLVKDMK